MQLVQVGKAVSRRGFLGACGGCVAAAFCHQANAAPAPGDLIPKTRPRLGLVFSHIAPDKATWPYAGYDYEGRKKELTARLREACPNVEFVVSSVINAEQARALLASGPPVDGYLNYLLGIWSGATSVLAGSGKPVLLVDDLYGGSGEFLVQYAAAKRQGLKVAGVSSTRFADVVQGVRAFEALAKLKQSVILDVRDRDPGAIAKAIEDVFGTKVRMVS
ncbi:MAG: hypothetical protein NTY38_33870, partial [Acidobacteria bacterium]|nr:hypothetical protein [Acidobacteriota bacterium]